MSMRTEPFSFTRNDLALRGFIDYPGDRPPLAGIVLVPGHGGTNIAGGKQFLDLRTRFTAAGLACCAWDRPGCGASEGQFDINQTVRDSGEEAAAAVDAFARQAGLDLPRIGFWGRSRGVGIGLETLKRRPALGFWISVSPGGDHDNSPYLLETNLRLEGRSEAEVLSLMAEWRTGEKIIRTEGTYEEYLAATANLRADPFRKFLDGLGFGVTEEVFQKEQARHRAGEYEVDRRTEIKQFPELFQGLASVRCPALALFGEKDTNVDWRDTARLYREAFAAGGNPDVTICTFPDGNHVLLHCETGGLREMWGQMQAGNSRSCEGYYETMLSWLRQRGFASGSLRAKPRPPGDAPSKEADPGQDRVVLFRKRVRKLLSRRIPDLIEKGPIVGCSGAVIFNAGDGVEYFGYGETKRGNGVTPDADTLYEIGSITKLLTDILFADSVRRKEVGVDDPLQKHMPPDVVVPRKNGKEVTLLHLATHRHGLPTLLCTGDTLDSVCCIKDMTEKDVLRIMTRKELRSTPGEKFAYMDEGHALLGFALKHAAGIESFDTFQKQRLSSLLGMKDTVIWTSALTPEQRKRLATPYCTDPKDRFPFQPGQGFDPKDYGENEVPCYIGPYPMFVSSPRDLVALTRACLKPDEIPEGPDLKHWLDLLHRKDPAIMHGGVSYGSCNYFGFNREEGVGFILCGNNRAANGMVYQASREILGQLAALSKKINDEADSPKKSK